MLLLIAFMTCSVVANSAEVGAPKTARPVGLSQLNAARDAEAAAKFAQAEGILRSALKLDDLQKPERDQIETELKQVRMTLQQSIELNAIERMIEHGQKDEAVKRLLALLPKSSNGLIMKRIDRLLAEDPPYFSPIFDKLISLSLMSAPYLLIAIGLLWLRWAIAQTRWAANRSATWQLQEVSDGTARNSKELITHYFSYWSRPSQGAVTSGLLLAEATSLSAGIPLDIKPDRYDIAKRLADVDLKVWGLSLASFANLGTIVSRWMLPQPTAISGTIYFDDNKKACARLATSLPERNRNDKDGVKVIAVSALAEGPPEEALRRAAEEVTFKMIYALANEGDVLAAESGNELRTGIRMLTSYLSANADQDGTPWNCLESARSIFEKIRKARPELLEAHLYEGIALDLLERHEDATAHFDFVKHLTDGAPTQAALYQRAAYNGAVARLRTLYELDGIRAAIAQFQELIAANLQIAWADIDNLLAIVSRPAQTATETAQVDAGLLQPLLRKPIATLALATLADAWANLAIHWKKLKAPGESDTAALDRVVTENERNVLTNTAAVEAVLKLALPKAQQKDSGWDSTTLRQVDWACANARADFFLYAAVALKKEAERHPPFEAQYKEFIEKALHELRRCEMLLPAGVETLSNIGTLYLYRDGATDRALARQYLQRAMALNPHYEYVYYRLAQSWELDLRRDKVIEVLKSFPNPPAIPSFQAMFTRYYVEPKPEFAV